jgi:hypothetical protein
MDDKFEDHLHKFVKLEDLTKKNHRDLAHGRL